MNTIGVLLLAAATAGQYEGFGSYVKPRVGLKPLLRAGVVANGPAPPGGMIGGDAASYPAPSGRRFPNTRSQIFFLDPNHMKIGWQTAGAAPNCEKVYVPGQLTVPARYNFNQGYIYRLKLTEIPGREGVALYPTIEVAPSTPATDAYLTHNPIPVQFTAEDFDQVVDGGNFVTKVIYLPDPKYQELAIAGVETLVSTRLEPGVDPILEADKRGTILLIVRLGAIDLEMSNTAVVTVPPGVMMPGAVAPDALPPGVVVTPGPAAPVTPAPTTVPVDTAPVTPVTPANPPLPATTTPPPPPPPGTGAANADLPELPKT